MIASGTNNIPHDHSLSLVLIILANNSAPVINISSLSVSYTHLAMNFLKAGISGFIGICCLGAKVLGDTQANWPYAAVLICAIVTVAYIKPVSYTHLAHQKGTPNPDLRKGRL